MADQIKPTEDHQRLILAGLMQYPYVFAMIKDDINDGFFSDASCRIIYKSLESYYDSYAKMPSELELMSAIDDNYIELGVPKSDVQDIAVSLLNSAKLEEKFLVNKAAEFVKKVRVSRVLNRSFEKIQNGGSINNETLLNEMISSLTVNYDMSGIFTISDTEMLDIERQKAVGNGSGHAIIKSILPSVNENLLYGGFQRGTLNMVVAPPGTGKTSYLVNEGAYAALQGFNIVHIFLGDMVKYDGFIRYLSCLSGQTQQDLVSMSLADQDNVVFDVQGQNEVLSRIHLLAYGSGELTVKELIEILKKEQDRMNLHFDQIIVDYADNFSKDNTNLYVEGGDIYNDLALFARMNDSVIMVASQPKQEFWKEEIIPLEGAAESSKKQQIVDVFMTFNLVSRNSNLGTVHLAKVRRGTTGRFIRVETHWDACKILEITEEYEMKKSGMYQKK